MTNLPPKVQRRRDELRKDVHGDAEAASDPSKNLANVASICWREGFDACYTEYVEPLREALELYSREDHYWDEDIASDGTVYKNCSVMEDWGDKARTTLAKLGLDDGGSDE